MKINVEKILTINKIIERDKLESSYKLALLKSLILTIKKFDHHIHIIENKEFVKIPFYFIVEEWFFYYLPFVYLNIRQHRTNKLVLNSKIEGLYKEIFTLFSISCKQNDWKCIYALIYKKYFNFELNTNTIFREFRRLIINNPMKYMGEREYELFPKERITKPKRVSRRNFEDFGYFEIEKEIYTILKYLGDNFYGTNTILFRWEELLYNVNSFKDFKFVKDILTHNIDEISRDTTLIRKFLFSIKEPIFCIWSGKRLSSFDVDHLLPFSLFFNNDYWNLLPTNPKINNTKRDKIPSPSLIENSQERILRYWSFYKKEFKEFKAQRDISLGKFETEEEYIKQLKNKTTFLIDTLGYEPFEV